MSILTSELTEKIIASVLGAGKMLTAGSAVHEIHAKNPTDFVTDVDLAVQERLRTELSELAPEVQFMGEEQDNSGIDPSLPFWILDPVDGTTNLIRGLRHSAVSLALAEGGELSFGAVYNPFAGELFTARRGGGAFLNGSPIHVSRARSLGESLICVGTAPSRREWSDRVFNLIRALFDRSIDIRRSGCASLDLCDVALGRMDAYVEGFLQPWDYAAGALIAAEAGGRVTGCEGEALSLVSAGGLLSSNGLLHEEILAIIRA